MTEKETKRLPDETLENAIKVYERTLKVTGDNGEYCYAALDKATLEFLNELRAYRDAEEQGLLLRLPCKVGDTVFVIPSRVNCALNRLNGYSENNRVYVQRVHSIRMYSNDRYLLVTCEGLESVLSDTYKETWFLTKEEAEAALEKLKGE